ncbi:MAG: hypothetical protein H7Z71_03600 [Moraxellaceae bacterium]|nr:hypothetical protein [Pseudobdellovibrionaceae bacterium]
MNNLTTDKMNKVNNVANSLLNKIPASPDQIENMVHRVGEKAGELTSSFTQKATDTLDNSREYVKANPVKGVAIAAVAGIAVGSLLTLMFSRKEH